MSRIALQQVAVARSFAGADVRIPAGGVQVPLRLVTYDPEVAPAGDAWSEDDTTEASLLAFDADDDLGCLVPMPTSIPRAVRVALMQAFERQYEHYDELDVFLHAPHDALSGATPYERIVAGDGLSVLRALDGRTTLVALESDHAQRRQRAHTGRAANRGGTKRRVFPAARCARR